MFRQVPSFRTRRSRDPEFSAFAPTRRFNDTGFPLFRGNDGTRMSIPESFQAFRIRDDDAGYRAGIEPMQVDALSPGEVVIKTAYSSV
ncbi:MAG TPA: hypothetical protein VJ862_02120, partial [Rhodanobacteraceae bacterium]|nr:hypothetical protein [Rhodanobacteraceae bacterium]